MSTITTKIVASTVAGIALAGVSTTANADTLPKSDRAAVKQANKECKPVKDQHTRQACVLGAFSQLTGKIYGEEDFEVSKSGKVSVTRTQTPVKVKVTKATKADQRYLKAAFAQANTISGELDAQWLNVLVGEFEMLRGRYISADWISFSDAGIPKLERHSVRVSDTVKRAE